MDDKKKTEIISALREAFPHGHEGFIPLLVDAMELHSNKNFDYAASGDSLGNFDRVAHFWESYPIPCPNCGTNVDNPLSNPVLVSVAYKLKQLDAETWQLVRGYEGKVEGVAPRCVDQGVYSFLEILITEALAAKKQKE